MPMYEYHCLDCHKHFDLLRSYEQRDNGVRCPECNGERAKRTVSAFATLSAINSDKVPAGFRQAGGGGGGCACGGNCGCGHSH